MALLCPKCEEINKCDCKSCNPDGNATDLVIILKDENLYQCCLFSICQVHIEEKCPSGCSIFYRNPFLRLSWYQFDCSDSCLEQDCFPILCQSAALVAGHRFLG